jgi:hypothetical protein
MSSQEGRRLTLPTCENLVVDNFGGGNDFAHHEVSSAPFCGLLLTGVDDS